MSIIDDLNWRYACKAFDPSKKLTKDQINLLLDSLRLTASSYGLQPWKFVLVETPELREKLVSASWNQKQVVDASHLIVLCAPIHIDEDHVDRYMASTAKARGQDLSELAKFKEMLMKMIVAKDETWQKKWAANQLYIALGTLMTVCAHLRIDSCPMEGFKPSEYDQILGLTEMGLRSVLVCPVGFRAESDAYIAKAKSRFDLDDLVIKL